MKSKLCFPDPHCDYCALQVSCLGRVVKWHPSMSLYKLTAYVSCSTTKLSTREPLPIYPFHWTTNLQSAVPVNNYNAIKT